MTRLSRVALLATIAGLGACSRPEPPQTPDSPAADTAPAPAPSSPDVLDSAGATTTIRDTARPAAPRPAPAPVNPPKDSAPARPPAPAPAAVPDTAPADAPLRDAYHQAPRDTVDARTYQGWKYYNLHCARCHGEDASGTTIAPHLILSLKPDGPIPDASAFLQVVCSGRPEKGMPAWCALGLLPGEIDTIYAYVQGRSAARLHPGRPARRAE